MVAREESGCLHLVPRSSAAEPSSSLGCVRSRSRRSPRTSASPSPACGGGWRRPDIDEGKREGLSTDERKELVELRRQKRVLEMEVEILKRASAYFARENVLPK
jgi:transposase-like protein